MTDKQHEVYFQDWQQREELSERMLTILGKLDREQDVIIMLYGRILTNCSPIEILKAHRYVRQVEDPELSIHDSFPILEAIAALDLAPAKVDLGKLAVQALAKKPADINAFVAAELASVTTGKGTLLEQPQDVVLYGFGRIGRVLARFLVESAGSGNKLRLRASVGRKSIEGA